MSIFLGMVSVAPFSGVASAAQADLILVEAGGPYYNYGGFGGENDTYQITATQMQAGVGPYTGSTPEVTIYNETMVIVVNAQPMNLVDAALGLYNYSDTCGGMEVGTYHVVVSGTNSTTSAITATGLASFEVAQLEMKIEIIEPNPVIIDVEAGCYFDFIAMVAVQLTQDGEAYVLDPADDLRITVWQSGGFKDVDNDTMTAVDASAGLYNYDFNPPFSGVWIVVVNLTLSSGGLAYTGMDQLVIPPRDLPVFELFIDAAWDSDLLVTAQITRDGSSYNVDTMMEEARVTVWELYSGTMVVNNELMDYFDDTIGLFNYSAYVMTSGPVYIWVEYTSGITGANIPKSMVLQDEIMFIAPAPPAAVDIHVETGYIHDPWTNGLGITAIITEEGEQRPDTGATTVRATIYHSDRNSGALTKVLDNQTMGILDGPRGMYSYIWSPAFFDVGFYHIIIEANWGGSYWYAGTTSTDVADWVGHIYDTDMKTDAILFWLDNFEDTWDSWQMFFNNYTDDINATLTNINNTIANISFVMPDFSPMEELLKNISGNLSMVDQNVSNMNLQVNANAIQLANIIAMLTNIDADQAVIDQVLNEFHTQFKDYRNTWNITLNQMINDLDFQNLTVLTIQSGLADLRVNFGQFWDQFNSTMTSTVNDWFNITWSRIDLFEANVTSMINSQNINFTMMEGNIIGVLNDQNLNISRLDQNLTNINASIQAQFQVLFNEHAETRSLISDYWAAWNVTITNIQNDIDWLNQTLVVVLSDIGDLHATVQAFWTDFNTTWNDYIIGFNAYWQLLNLTIEGVNQTLQDDISALSQQMTGFEGNITVLLNDISGSIAAIDQNVSSMRTAMDSHFVQLWNEHNETRTLVGLYWAQWNATINGIVNNLDYVNMTTIATNSALTTFKNNFAIFWDGYNATEASHSAEVSGWFTDTWSMMADLEGTTEALINDQNANLSDMDDQMMTGFQNLYGENQMTRSHVSVYWNEWNTTRDQVQSDLDFIDSELAELGEAGDARSGKITINQILLIIILISAIFMMIVFRKYIAYSLGGKKK